MNRYRVRHGAPELVWDTECREFAQRRVDEMEEGPIIWQKDGDNESQGQIACGEALNFHNPAAPAEQVRRWYADGVGKYNSYDPELTAENATFVQMMWRKTVKVGMAIDEDGRFMVANFWPLGIEGSKAGSLASQIGDANESISCYSMK